MLARTRSSNRPHRAVRAAALAAVAVALGIAAVAPAPARGDAPAAPPATAPTTRPSSAHPAAAVAVRFNAALVKGDADAALKALADTAKPLPDQPRRLGRLVNLFKDDKNKFAVHDVLADGDLAVAIVGQPATVGDSTFDADSWFLVRQNGEWRVLPDYHAYNRPEYGFDAKQLEAYGKLEEAADKRVRRLKFEITGCEC